MPTALGYPGLRCVLEFLDPMRRIHIVSRSRSLRTIDKTIPLIIKELGIHKSYLKLNDYVIDNYTNNKLWFENGRGKCFERIYLANLNPEEALRKLIESYMETRSKIHVNRLNHYGWYSQQIPSNFIFLINELRCSLRYIDGFLANIDPISFPLKQLRTAIRVRNHLNHPVLTSAKELIVLDRFDGLIQLINQNNTNKRVTFETYSLRSADLVSLVRSWKDNGKEIGTTFKFLNYNSFMNSLLEEFEEFENERFNHSLNCPRLIIPINSTAEIHVFQDKEDNIVVEVVPTTFKRESDAK